MILANAAHQMVDLLGPLHQLVGDTARLSHASGIEKRLLACLLSFTMLTSQVLPVVAADDADVTVSENVTAEEETEETGSYDIELEEEEAGDADDAEEGEFFYDIAAEDEDVIADEYSIDNDIPSYIYVGDTRKAIIPASVTIQGTTYDLNTTVEYESRISYRARKIKPYEDLGAVVTSSGLNDMVQELASGGGDIHEMGFPSYNGNPREHNWDPHTSPDMTRSLPLACSL